MNKPNKEKRKELLIDLRNVIPFDEPSFCGELAFGYSNKKQAIKIIEEVTGEKIVNPENMQKLKVKKITRKDGEEYYTWANKCEHCGEKIIGGVWSWADFN